MSYAYGMGQAIRIIGIDPGLRRTGWGVVETSGNSLRFIAAESKRRGLKFQLGLWNHAYDYGRDSVHRYPITGVGPDNHAAYCGAGIAKLLTECPDIDGLTFRVHYEGGIPDDRQLRVALSFGYPAEDWQPAKMGGRKPLDDVVRWERW